MAETNTTPQTARIDLSHIEGNGSIPVLPEEKLRGLHSAYEPEPLTKLAKEAFAAAGFEVVNQGEGGYVKFCQPKDFLEHDFPEEFPPIRFLPGGKQEATVYLTAYADGFYPVALDLIEHDLGTEHIASLVGFDGLFELISLSAVGALSDIPTEFPSRRGLHEDVQRGGLLSGEEKKKRVTSEIDVLTDLLGGTDFDESSEQSQLSAGYLHDFISLLKNNGLIESSTLINKCAEELGLSTHQVTGAQLLRSMFVSAREKCRLKPETGNSAAGVKRLLGRLSLRK